MNTPMYTDHQIDKILLLLKQKRVSIPKLQKLFGFGFLSDLFGADLSKVNRDDLRRALGYLYNLLEVDYESSIKVMIYEGYFECIDKHLDYETFPELCNQHGRVMYEWKLFEAQHPKESAQEIVNRIKLEDERNPWEPAKIEHMLAYGAKYLQRTKKIVVGFGSHTYSSSQSYWKYPSISTFVQRCFDLEEYPSRGRLEGTEFQFLAVRKLKMK